jgi:hypothetical protein
MASPTTKRVNAKESTEALKSKGETEENGAPAPAPAPAPALKRERDENADQAAKKKSKVTSEPAVENGTGLKSAEAVKGKSESESSSSSASASSANLNPFLQSDIKTKIDPKLAPPPTRDANGRFTFKDFPNFHPNLSPKEVLQMGSFGGTYFRSISSDATKKRYGDEVWKELPAAWLQGLNIKKQVSSPKYDLSVNRYKAKSGASLEEWEQSGWMRDCDPYGWFQWYCRFFQGRRCADDDRQISRGNKCFGPTGRWKTNLCNKIVASAEAGKSKGRTIASEIENYAISPVIRQTLQHWGFRVTDKDFKAQK